MRDARSDDASEDVKCKAARTSRAEARTLRRKARMTSPEAENRAYADADDEVDFTDDVEDFDDRDDRDDRDDVHDPQDGADPDADDDDVDDDDDDDAPAEPKRDP